MKNTTEHKDKRAFSMIVVMSFMAIISTFLAMLAFSSSQRAATATRLTSKIKAKAMAEAGCEYAYAVLKENWDGRYQLAKLDNLTPSSVNDESGTSPINGGAQASLSGVSVNAAEEAASYQVKIEPINSTAVLVTSTGTCGSVSDISIISVQDRGGSSNDGTILDEEAFSYAILCGGEFTFRGCGTISSPGGDALFHANGPVDNRGNTHALINISSSTAISSGNITFGGDVTAPSLDLHKKAVVKGTTAQKGVSPVTIPDIDLTPYYNYALKNGEVHNGFSFSSSYTPKGGILWVEGDVHGSSGATINGSIIATGDISLAGSVSVNPTTCAFGLVSRDGNIKITSSGALKGLIYVKTGSFEHTANGAIYGQLIVNGDIKKGGNSDIMAGYTQNIPSVPGGNTSTDNIVISAWQR